jgi:MFS family permease
VSLREAPPPSSPSPAHWGAGLGTGFWALCAGTFINRAGTMVVPFMTLYLVSTRGFSVVAAGEVVAGFGAGAIIAPLIGGALADHVGRRITLLAATLITAAIMVALAYVRSTGLIVALVVLLGAGLEAPRPVTQALVADLVAERDRVRAYAVLFWVGNLGFAAAMAPAGFVAQSGFVLVFWIDGISGCLFGGLVWRFVSEKDRRAARVEPCSRGYGQVLNDRPMVGFIFAVMIYYFVYLQSDATLSLAVRASGLPPHVYGLCMALNGVLICVAQPMLAPRLMRLDPGRVWAAGLVVVGVGFGLTAAVSTAAGYLLSVGIWTVGEIFPATVSGAIVIRLAPEHLRGRYSGLYGFALASGWLTSSIGGTRLLAASPLALWGSCAGLCVASACGVLRLSSSLRRVGPHPSS